MKKAEAGGERLDPGGRRLVDADASHMEANHRIANSLQLVSALLTSQGRELTDPDARLALDNCGRRIAAIAGVHRQLFLGGTVGTIDVASYLLDLLGGLQQGFSRTQGHRELRLEVEPASVSTEFATILGIVVTELVINACKHAYLADEPGVVDVVLTLEDSRFGLEVRDYGRGIAVPGMSSNARVGLGSRLLELMARRLSATGGYAPRDTGSSYLLKGIAVQQHAAAEASPGKD